METVRKIEGGRSEKGYMRCLEAREVCSIQGGVTSGGDNDSPYNMPKFACMALQTGGSIDNDSPLSLPASKF